LQSGRDGAPVEAAEVRLEAAAGGPLAFRGQTTTDKEGRFFIGGVAPGVYRLTAHRTRWSAGCRSR
jgi:protocatechuate 3,4-dioxygenase beta subunit